MTKIPKGLLALVLCIALCIPSYAVCAEPCTEYLGAYTVTCDGESTALSPDTYATSVAAVTEEVEYIDSFERLVEEAVRLMSLREAQIVLHYSRLSIIEEGFFDTFFDSVFEHTGNPRGGDYLRYHYSSYKARYDGFKRGGVYYYTITLNMKYYTNAEQEKAVDAAVESVVSMIEGHYSTDYEKISALYRFVTNNTVYDDKNLNDNSYSLKYSAYAALINKTSVCQGYANLIYRIALELGIDCRIVTGLGAGGAHSWNIIRADDGKYYLFDATWDATRLHAGLDYDYFFKGSKYFDEHVADDSFLTADFTSSHPISDKNYEQKTVEHVPVGSWYVYRYAANGENGEKVRICSVCGGKGDSTSIPYVHAEAVYKNYTLKAWSRDGIDFVSSNGLMGDTGNGDFNQTGKMTRSMFVTVLYRLAGSPEVTSVSPFGDLDPAQSWYHSAVIWAFENGIVTGTSATTFAPDTEVTREQIATFLYRYTVNYLKLDVSGVKNDISSFPDAGSVGSYARDALTWANGVGLIKGQSSGGTSLLAPKNDATREEVAVIISRFCTAE